MKQNVDYERKYAVYARKYAENTRQYILYVIKYALKYGAVCTIYIICK